MDVLDTFYVVPMKLVEGSDDTFAVRWYPAAAGAKEFPGEHAFGATAWEGYWREIGVGPGEVTRSHKTIPRHNRGYAGTCLPTHPEWFLTGIPAVELAKPCEATLCCTRALTMNGGPMCGGSVLFATRFAGDLVLDGTFAVTPSLGVFTGELVFDGMWDGSAFAGDLVLDGAWEGNDFAGDLVLDGAWAPPDPAFTFAGDLVLDGAWAPPDPAFTFAGDLVLDGAAEEQEMDAGLVLDGDYSL